MDKAPVIVETVLARASIEGRVEYQREADPTKQVCACCPAGTGHVFGRGVKFPQFKSVYPDHFGFGAQEFLATVALYRNEWEGKRVRLTVEVLEDTAK